MQILYKNIYGGRGSNLGGIEPSKRGKIKIKMEAASARKMHTEEFEGGRGGRGALDGTFVVFSQQHRRLNWRLSATVEGGIIGAEKQL
jgi:hypothetical protein